MQAAGAPGGVWPAATPPIFIPQSGMPLAGVLPLTTTMSGAAGQSQAGDGLGGPGTGAGRRRELTFIPGKVFLGGISNDTNEESLQAYCGQWGEITDVHVMKGKGYAFVTFAAVPTAQAFLEHREHYIDGRKVDAKAAVPKDQGGGGKLTRKLFVGGIGDVSDAEFQAHFANLGLVEECIVLRKPDGSSRGFGFVTFADEVCVEKCLVMEHHLAGRRVDVKRAVGKDQQDTGGGGMGARGGGMVGMQQMGGGRTQGMGSQDRTQDWTCAECGNTNYGWRHTCNRCKTRRSNVPGGSTGGGAGGNAGGYGAGGGGSATGMGMGMAGGSMMNPAMLGMMPAGLMAGMLQNAGMPGMAGMNPMQNLNLAAMGSMGMPAGMGGMPMGTMAGMPAMMGLGGMDASGMNGAGAGSMAGGMGGMGALMGTYGLNPMVMAGMQGGAGNYTGMGGNAGGYGMAGMAPAGPPPGGASEGGEDAAGAYGRITGGRGTTGGQQRYRPY